MQSVLGIATQGSRPATYCSPVESKMDVHGQYQTGALMGQFCSQKEDQATRGILTILLEL